MRIIIEWCDKTGKTTLANYLSESLWMKIVKFSAPKVEDVFWSYQTFFGTVKENKKKAVNDNIIVDRSRIGEAVYWPIYRKKGLKKFQIKRLDEACKINNDLIIRCDTDKWTIKKKFIEDKEDFAQAKDIGRIQRYFLKVMKWLKTTVIQYDWKLSNMDSIVYIIREMYKEEAPTV